MYFNDAISIIYLLLVFCISRMYYMVVYAVHTLCDVNSYYLKLQEFCVCGGGGGGGGAHVAIVVLYFTVHHQ